MQDFLLLMHDDAPRGGPTDDARDWPGYLAGLKRDGHLAGGSEIGAGACVRKHGAPGPLAAHLVGYVRVRAASLRDALRLVEGNPGYEAGATIEVRELPRSD